MRRTLLCVTLLLCLPGAARAAPVVRATVDPAVVHVGDPFLYTVVARVPKAAGGELRVIADPGAFVQLAGPAVSRSSKGGDTLVTVSETLVCLDLGCVSGAKPRPILLPAPQLLGVGAPLRGRRIAVTVTPRVPAGAVAAGRPAYRSDTSAPALSVRLPLGAAAALAIVIGVALAGAAGLLVAAELRRRPSAASGDRRSAPDLTLALQLLRESARRPEPDRRRAADLVARLATPEVVDEATRVAWAEPAPGPADLETLAVDVERVSERGR